jgi:hypothetical protein
MELSAVYRAIVTPSNREKRQAPETRTQAQARLKPKQRAALLSTKQQATRKQRALRLFVFEGAVFNV